MKLSEVFRGAVILHGPVVLQTRHIHMRPTLAAVEHLELSGASSGVELEATPATVMQMRRVTINERTVSASGAVLAHYALQWSFALAALQCLAGLAGLNSRSL